MDFKALSDKILPVLQECYERGRQEEVSKRSLDSEIYQDKTIDTLGYLYKILAEIHYEWLPH